MGNCLDSQRLQEWLNGNLGAESDDVSKHVESCGKCQQRLELLIDGESMLPSAIPELLNNRQLISVSVKMTERQSRGALAHQISGSWREILLNQNRLRLWR